MSADAALLKSLCLAPGPTGFEAPAQEVVRRRLAPLGEVQADPLGNVWLDVGPAGDQQVVVTAHADQIGLIVTYVDDHGYVSVEKIGGVAPLLTMLNSCAAGVAVVNIDNGFGAGYMAGMINAMAVSNKADKPGAKPR